MNKRMVATVFAVLSLFSVTFAATYSGGSGTIADPYLISSAADVQTLSQTPGDWASAFELSTDVNASAMTLSPIGSFATPFSGTFNGNSNTITYTYNDELDSDWFAGLFGYNTGTIYDLEVNGTLTPQEMVVPLESGWIGGIVALNGGTISNCTFSSGGSITVESSGGDASNVAVGGIAGGNDGSINNSSFLGSITGDVFNVYVGGIAGSTDGTISGCGFNGFATIDIGYVDVFSEPYDLYTTCGGITGYVTSNGQVIDCSSADTAMVTSGAFDGYVGGLVGINSGMIDMSTAEADVSFTSWSGQVGGLCGWNYFGYISESEAICDVTATMHNAGNYTGGFVGLNRDADIVESYFFGDVQSSSVSSIAGLFAGANSVNASIENSYAIGNLTGTSTNLIAMIVGGFVGVNDESASITNSYVADKTSKTAYTTDNETNAGGFIGYKESGTITAGMWDYQTMGLDSNDGVGYGSDAGVTGQTTTAMKTQSTFTTAGWNFSSIWTMSQSSSAFEGYPILAWQGGQVFDTLDITLVPGWNWISFNVLPQDTTLSNVLADFASIAADGDQILAENGLNATYFGGQWFGTLETSGSIEPGEMYKLRSANGGTITVEGTYVDPATQIQLVQGWNWLGYTLSGPANFTDAISTLNAVDNDYITNQLGQNSTYYGGTWYGTLATLQPGLGYMLRVANAQSFVYNNVVTTDISVPKLAPSNAPDWESPLGLQNTMTLYAQIETPLGVAVATQAGSLLSAWNGESIAGVVEVSAGPFGEYYQLSVYSDATNVPGMTLKVYDSATDTIYPINETFNFISGEDVGEFIDPEIFTIGEPTVYYTVTFDAGVNGQITSGSAQQQVEEGTNAVAPTVTANTGWVFTGWDVAYTNVTSNLTVTAQYEPQTFTVTFNAGSYGSITAGNAVQVVNYGADAVAPTVTATAGWEFIGWDATFTNVTSDLTVNAVYDVPEYTVTFEGGAHGDVTGDVIQTVQYGQAATAPTVIPDTGWSFIGWNKAFDNVTEDMTVTAIYEVQTFLVTFDSCVHGDIVAGQATQTIAYGQDAVAPTIQADTGWIFTGWDTDFTNVTSNLTVLALYEAQTFTVNFNAGNYGVIYSGNVQQTVAYGSDANAPVIMPQYGYKLIGWDNPVTNITGNVTTTAQYAAIGDITCFDADVNDDLTVDQMDLEMLADSWLSNGSTLEGDIDGNNWANLWDYNILSDCWLASLGVELDINLVVGTNWISFNVLPEGAAIADVMADYSTFATDGDKLLAEDGKNATYFGGDWFGTLDTIMAGEMYKLKTAQAGTFTVQGNPVDPETPIELVAGWNWLGYTPAQAMPLNTLMAGLNAANGDYIAAQNGKNATYWGGTWYGQLTELKPGMGYMLKVANAQTFTYNTVAVGTLDASVPVSIQAAPATWVSPVGLQFNMSINAQVMQGLNYVGTGAGSLLSAWDPDGNIAGVAAVIDSPAGKQFQLSVYSDQANVDDMTLRLYDADTDMVYNVIETFDFADGDSIGVLITPEIYHIPEAWTNPVGLDYQMALYAQVELDGQQIATAPGSMLSVWDPQGNIAGVAQVTNGGPAGFLFIVTIFSDALTVDNMTLKLYDSATGLYYDINGTIDFEANTTAGSFMDPIVFEVGAIDWFEEYTADPASTWVVNGNNLESGAVPAMTGSGVSSPTIDISGFNTATFDVQTDCGNQCFLIFGITDTNGVYHIVDYWSGVTPLTSVSVDLAPYKTAGNTVTFRWTYSKGRYTAGADKVWVWNFNLN